jgi:hypothetical protein
MLCNFLRWLFTPNLKQNINMAQTLTDLQNALDSLTVATQQNSDAASAVLTAANSAADRAAANVPQPIDYSRQVDQVNDVITNLGLAIQKINDAAAAANTILP